MVRKMFGKMRRMSYFCIPKSRGLLLSIAKLHNYSLINKPTT